MAGASVERMEAVSEMVSRLKDAYPDATKLKIDISFEWQEPNDVDLDSELCPVVSINIERQPGKPQEPAKTQESLPQQHHGSVWKEGEEYRSKCVCGWADEKLADTAQHAWDDFIIHMAVNVPRVNTGAF